jgi:cyclohexanecarboxylate-CoA ligase
VIGERVCAVAVPAGQAPGLAELRTFLRGEGVRDLHMPEQLEVVQEMPRTATGKIRKVELRQRYDPAV